MRNSYKDIYAFYHLPLSFYSFDDLPSENHLLIYCFLLQILSQRKGNTTEFLKGHLRFLPFTIFFYDLLFIIYCFIFYFMPF